MKKALGLIAMLVSILPLTVYALATVDMFGSTGKFNVCTGCAPGGLGMVDQTTGLYSFIGDPTVSNTLSGIDFDPSGVLFGTENISGGAPSASSLITIDPATGGLLSTVGATKDVPGQDIKLSDLAFQPGTGVLFAFSNTGFLYTINTSTAVATLIGIPGLSGGGGLAFTSSGSLFVATSHNKFAELSPTTGATVGAAILMNRCFDGLAARPTDDVLFGTECDGQGIYTIDKVTGASTLVGNSGTFTTDLAFRVTASGPPKPITPIPTLSARGVLLLLLVLMSTGIYLRRKI